LLVLVIVALVLAVLAVAGTAALMYQHGRVLLFVRDLDARLIHLERGPTPELPAGLPVGTVAPDFALPDLEGNERRLNDLLGQPLLLVFFSPQCGYCARMAPELGALPEESHRVVVVSRGDVADHRRIVQEHRWRHLVLLDEDWEVMSAYQATGTPTGYLLDAEGRIASPLAVGAEALLVLARADAVSAGSNGHGSGLTPEPLREKEEAGERARRTGLAVRDIADSRITRDGLKAGTEAPNFVLPDLDGTPRSLVDFRGRRVLLVFSDVDCGPCDALAPDLVALTEKGVQIVMISRGDPVRNRAKAAEKGYSFPVILQRSWEVSKQYGMFATPIGYLIDEQGVLAKDVAVGPEAILSLAEVS
jgi:peroxiredoxin